MKVAPDFQFWQRFPQGIPVGTRVIIKPHRRRANCVARVVSYHGARVIVEIRYLDRIERDIYDLNDLNF